MVYLENKLMRCFTTENFIQDKRSELRRFLLRCNANRQRLGEIEAELNGRYPTLVDAAISLHTKEHGRPFAVLSAELVAYLQIPKRKKKKAFQATKRTLLDVHDVVWSLVDHD